VLNGLVRVMLFLVERKINEFTRIFETGWGFSGDGRCMYIPLIEWSEHGICLAFWFRTMG
jgi:hypothetical protein